MDFMNRDSQQQRAHTPASATAASSTGSSVSSRSGKHVPEHPTWQRWASIVMLFVTVLLVASVVVLLYTERPKAESGFVDKSKLQAVFLNTSQVYFGKLQSVNDQYFVLSDIYYLQTSSAGTTTTASANTNVSLVKLGCELHQPYDKMVINRSQVTFWENLQDGGQVAKAVVAYQKANPNGQKCTDQTTNSAPSNVQGTTTTTPSTTTKTAP